MANLITRQDTDVYSNAEIKIDVQISDMEQVIINDEVTTHKWDNATSQWVYTTDPRKFQIIELQYGFDMNSDTFSPADFPTKEVLRLKGMKGYYFRKGNKKIGTRETTFWHGLTDEQIKQIPDRLHNYARAELEKVLKKKLERVLQHGVVIEGKLNA